MYKYMYLLHMYLPLCPEYAVLGLISHGSGILSVQRFCPVQLLSHPALLEVGMQNHYAGSSNNRHFY